MNILFLIGWPLDHGGHITSALSLAQELIKKGHKISLIAPNGPMSNVFKENGIEYFPCDLLTRKSPYHLLATAYIYRVSKSCSTQIIHVMDFKSLYPAYFMASLLKLPLVFTKAGGTAPSYRIPPISRVVVLSDELRQGMTERYPDLAGKFILVKERIDTEIFLPEENETRVTVGELKIFMAMRLEEGKKKWLIGALNGMRQLAKTGCVFSFTLAGGGPLREELEAEAKKINHTYQTAKISFVGVVTDILEMASHYRAADIVIGHGNGILEAMASAKPVIVLGANLGATLVNEDTVSSICEYNFSGRHVDVYPELAQDIIEIILSLASNNSERKRLGRFGRNYIEREYSVKVGAIKLVSIYEESMNSSLICRPISAFKWCVHQISSTC